VQINKSFVLAVALLLTACGYHLRGAYDLPKGLKNVYMEGGSPTLREQFDIALKSSSVQIVSSREKADVVLRIFQDEIEHRTLSLSARGRSNEIELAGHLEFQLINAKNEVLIDHEPIDFRRAYFNDQQDVIAKGNEETVIRKEMYQQVVRTLIRRASSVLKTKGK
jgi:LPS-assembly lipoprotein